MSKRETKAFFKALGACPEGKNWAGRVENLETVWNTCQRASWMLWALDRIGFEDDRKLRLYACACVRKTPLADGRTTWDLLTDERSRKAIEVAELYAEGKATEEELVIAWYAADDAAHYSCNTAYAAKATADINAARAAYDATYYTTYTVADAFGGDYSTVQTAQADLLRQYISWDEVDAAIKAYQRSEMCINQR